MSLSINDALLDRPMVTSMAGEILNRVPSGEELDTQDGKKFIDLWRAWTSDDNPERANIQRLLDLGIQADKAGWKPSDQVNTKYKKYDGPQLFMEGK